MKNIIKGVAIGSVMLVGAVGAMEADADIKDITEKFDYWTLGAGVGDEFVGRFGFGINMPLYIGADHTEVNVMFGDNELDPILLVQPVFESPAFLGETRLYGKIGPAVVGDELELTSSAGLKWDDIAHVGVDLVPDWNGDTQYVYGAYFKFGF